MVVRKMLFTLPVLAIGAVVVGCGDSKPTVGTAPKEVEQKNTNMMQGYEGKKK